MARKLRRRPSAGIDLGTPCAEKITGLSVSGISDSSSTKMAPLAFSPSTTYLLWTISWRT